MAKLTVKIDSFELIIGIIDTVMETVDFDESDEFVKGFNAFGECLKATLLKMQNNDNKC